MIVCKEESHVAFAGVWCDTIYRIVAIDGQNSVMD